MGLVINFTGKFKDLGYGQIIETQK